MMHEKVRIKVLQIKSYLFCECNRPLPPVILRQMARVPEQVLIFVACCVLFVIQICSHLSIFISRTFSPQPFHIYLCYIFFIDKLLLGLRTYKLSIVCGRILSCKHFPLSDELTDFYRQPKSGVRVENLRVIQVYRRYTCMHSS